MPNRHRNFDNVAEVVRALTPSYPVYCVRPHVLERNARRFVTLFPGKVLYAVKCNPHPLIIEALSRGGIHHFDTASLPEIAQIRESYEDAGAYFMHPVKARAVIRTAYRVYGIRHFVLDHIDELNKVVEETGGDDVIAIVRVKTPKAEGTLFHLAAKFGAEPEDAVQLLCEARRLGLETGLAFHVGSQCMDPGAYERAIVSLGEILGAAGGEISCLDVGGGFPGRYVDQEPPPLEHYIEAIRAGLKAIRLNPTVEIFCEPGRALVANAVSLLVQVQLRKGEQLYINDGIYGSLQELTIANMRLPARLVRPDRPASNHFETYAMNGPTCDSLDVVPGAFYLPSDLREGDWIEIDQIGAYSNALATHFNGFHPETFVTVHDTPVAATMVDETAPSVAPS